MKRLSIYLSVALLVVGASACQNNDLPPLGEPFSQVEGINGNWELVSVMQLDEINGDADEPFDVSNLMIGNQAATLTFRSSERSFSAQTGDSRLFIPETGSWAFDDDKYPTKVMLDGGGSSQFELALQAPVREQVDEFLIYKYIRPLGDCVADIEQAGAISYIYKFQRK